MRHQVEKNLKDRAYVLLDVSHGNRENVARALHSMCGVAKVDMLEGPPDVLMMIEAPGRRQLARLTIQALAAVEPMTEKVQLMPSANG